MKRGLIVILVALLSLSVGSAGNTQETTDQETNDAQTSDGVKREVTPGQRDRLPETTLECQFFRTIYDWHALDPYNLIVYFNNRNTPRLVELETPCYGIRFTDTIAFTDGVSRMRAGIGDGRLCSYAGDSVIVDGHFCEIGAIHKLSVDEADNLKKEYKDRYRDRGKKKQRSEAQDATSTMSDD